MSNFYEDVIRGLSASPKYLQSKYFYDQEGDWLFQQIMQSPEYYLTRCELEIFSEQTPLLAQALLQQYQEFDIVELGAGDATKSTFLLKYLYHTGHNFTYYPIDISKNVIQQLEQEMPERIPGLQIHGLNGEYFDMIKKANAISKRRKVVLFLGSNIGNFTTENAQKFLVSLQQHLMPGDVMIIGFDLKKNPKQILAAYNDAAGITRAFNLNLLKRINKELGANFSVDQFDHYPTYDPITGSCRSFLISLTRQSVSLGDNELFHFAENEPVYTELSQKYSVEEINTLAAATGFTPVKQLFDTHYWFLDAVWERMDPA